MWLTVRVVGIDFEGTDVFAGVYAVEVIREKKAKDLAHLLERAGKQVVIPFVA